MQLFKIFGIKSLNQNPTFFSSKKFVFKKKELIQEPNTHYYFGYFLL